MTDKYLHHKSVISFYKRKDLDKSEAVQEAYSRGFCAGIDSIPKGNETEQHLRMKIVEQQEMIDKLNRKIAKATRILSE